MTFAQHGPSVKLSSNNKQPAGKGAALTTTGTEPAGRSQVCGCRLAAQSEKASCNQEGADLSAEALPWNLLQNRSLHLQLLTNV